MYFCAICNNLLTPNKAHVNTLEFRCKLCSAKYVDFSEKRGEATMLYCKELKTGARSYATGSELIFDNTIPKIEVECPECLYNRAICVMAPDAGETKIVATLICASSTGTTAKCGNIWTLDKNTELLKGRIKDNFGALKIN